MRFRSVRKCFTTRRPSSHTRHGWIRLAPIVQNSPLLPPVGVWAVSQSSVAGRSLKPATDRRLGGLLPRQLANPASAAPIARGLTVPRFHLSISCGISQSFDWLSPTTGYVPMLYSPVRHSTGVAPCRRSTCMCKACRQRSI